MHFLFSCSCVDHEGRNLKSALPPLTGIGDRKLHMQRRTHWLRGLNAAALKDYKPIISKRVTQLVKQLEDGAGSTVDLSERLSYFSCVSYHLKDSKILSPNLA